MQRGDGTRPCRRTHVIRFHGMTHLHSLKCLLFVQRWHSYLPRASAVCGQAGCACRCCFPGEHIAMLFKAKTPTPTRPEKMLSYGQTKWARTTTRRLSSDYRLVWIHLIVVMCSLHLDIKPLLPSSCFSACVLKQSQTLNTVLTCGILVFMWLTKSPPFTSKIPDICRRYATNFASAGCAALLFQKKLIIELACTQSASGFETCT